MTAERRTQGGYGTEPPGADYRDNFRSRQPVELPRRSRRFSVLQLPQRALTFIRQRRSTS
jgi:hypothetical protein